MMSTLKLSVVWNLQTCHHLMLAFQIWSNKTDKEDIGQEGKKLIVKISKIC